MSVVLQLTPQDPLVARDGRPFGAGQGNRMRGLPWPLPSVVAGSFRTALVKANPNLTFDGDMPEKLMQVAVHGVFPATETELYLPSPLDCAYHKETKEIFRAVPQEIDAGCGGDFPGELRPVMLTAEQASEDFKAETPPAWWPMGKYVEWLTSTHTTRNPEWFDATFFKGAVTEYRDHVVMNAERGAGEEGGIFTSANLNLSALSPFTTGKPKPITLSARVVGTADLPVNSDFNLIHPLGGERRLVHWRTADSKLWECPVSVSDALKNTTHVRLVLASPAIFNEGWKPDLTREPFTGLKLVGASIGRWKAVSGWSLAPPRGPKPIRRMVPAGSVYFFTCEKGAAANLTNHWLQSVSDHSQAQRDGFGLATWGIW
jgi:CRISPR-associated protein Cmr3